MKLKKLFEPGRIGPISVPNRIVMIPVNLNYTEYPHRYKTNYIDILAERARGGVGLIITSHVKCETEIDPYLARTMPSLGQEDNFGVFAELTEAVHLQGGKIAVQLSAGVGRIADRLLPGKWPVSASAVPLLRHPQLVTRELSRGEIARLVEAYGEAAWRAERAGFDAIEVHCFGGLLIDQFLSPLWNRRTDKYGGSLENRMLFMVECVESAKSRVSPGYPFIARLTSDYMMKTERKVDEIIAVARRLEQLGIVALDLSAGCYDTLDWIMGTTYYPEGYAIPSAQDIKRSVNIPVIIAGRISDPLFAEKLLQENQTDFIGLGRSLLADPEWPKKAREGRIEDIRRCLYCDECIRRIHAGKYAKCAVNPALGREKDRKLETASSPRKVVVIGGGPGGLQAAIVAAQRGHDVILYEKSDKLGGSVVAASVPDFKAPMRLMVTRLAREAKEAGVKIKLGAKATVKSVRDLKPDVVVVATGAVPVMPNVTGIRSENVVTAIDVLLGNKKAGNEVVVLGGGTVGCETALYLAEAGKKVTIVEMLPDIASGFSVPQKLAISKLIAQKVSACFTGVKVERVTRRGVVISNKEGQKKTIKADTLVLAAGMEADDKLSGELQGKVPEVYVVGDAVMPRRIFDAIHEGDAVGERI